MSFRGEQVIKGTTYVFEAIAQWDADKQQSRQKRIYIGKKDPVTGAFLPNKKYYELYGEDADISDFQTSSVMKSVDFGNIYLMDQVSSACGLKQVLEETFPDCWEDILVCAMHSCSENEALYLCEDWALNSQVPAAPSSQDISRLLKELDEDRRMQFYKKWARLRSEKEYLALDISSVSSWSELINYVEYGYNRDHEDLPQVNLAMLFGEESRLPVFSRIYPGSVKDVSTLTGMVTFLEQLQLRQMHFVMDKGFYSAKGVGVLLEKYIKFAIGVPFSTGMAKEAVRENAAAITSPANAIEVDGHIYYSTVKKQTINGRRAYLHIYYDRERAAKEHDRLMHKIIKIENGLIDGTVRMDSAEAEKYFSFQKNKEGTYNIHRKEDIIREQLELTGYFVILTNDSKDSEYILNVYRTKDVVEKSFDNIKNELDLERLRIHSDKAMEGRIFIGFIALIITSYIRRIMEDKNLYSSYSLSKLYSELKKLRLIEFKNGKQVLTELTSSHKAIFKAFNLKAPVPSSL